jgi:hypothetical protein
MLLPVNDQHTGVEKTNLFMSNWIPFVLLLLYLLNNSEGTMSLKTFVFQAFVMIVNAGAENDENKPTLAKPDEFLQYPCMMCRG